MKNIYLIQANFLFGKDAYLPYSVGMLAAYAWQNPSISQEYDLGRFIFIRENIPESIASLENPFLVGFSCYTWNFEYNKAYAKELKKAYPNCIVLFGGHNVENRSGKLLESESYIDVLIHDEGEIPFEKLLLALKSETSLAEVPNISYRLEDGSIHSTELLVLNTLELPSPYLEGYFDQIIAEGTYDFSATLETNRGCPYQCSYCDWGNYKSKMRQFSLERVEKEIEWMSKNKIDFIFGADSNFGFYDRDIDIAQILVDYKKNTGYPGKFRVAYTKNSNEKVFEINRMLNEHGMCKGATLSFQSLNEPTLKAIKRINIPLDIFNGLMVRYKEANIPTYSEIILGLPEETYDTFCHGIGMLLENGQHTSINIYNCELLRNSRMAEPEYLKQYQVETVTNVTSSYHCQIDLTEVPEKSTTVIGTATMPPQDWIRANLFAWTVQTFHCLGIFQCMAIYLHEEKGTSYSEFYQNLYQYLEKHEKYGAMVAEIHDSMISYIENKGMWGVENLKYGTILWPYEEYSYLKMIEEIQEFYQGTKEFFQEYQVEPHILDELIRYQILILKFPEKTNFQGNFQYNWHQYFSQQNTGFQNKLTISPVEITVKNRETYTDLVQFATEVVWYGRKGGKNIETELESRPTNDT